jgi:predicted RNA methylase
MSDPNATSSEMRCLRTAKGEAGAADLAPMLIRFGGLSDGDRVLDVGCGTGSLPFTEPSIANIEGAAGISRRDRRPALLE